MRLKLFSTRTLYILLCVLVLTGLAAGFTYGVYTERRAASLKPKDTQLCCLRERVGVQFDARGVPYIRAGNRHDLFFAQGYITARDRLWQMDLLRRTARGELSEILGEAALAEDKQRRLYGFSALAEDMLNRVSPPMREALEAYTQGVNAYIESCSFGTWPLEFTLLRYRPRPWRATDSLVITKLYAEALSNTWRQDISREALAKVSPERRQEILPDTSPLDVLVVGSDKQEQLKVAGASPPDATRRALTHAGQQVAQLSAAEADTLRALDSIERINQRTFQRVGLYNMGRTISNGWVVSGARSVSGKPLLANDPHLDASVPSIWYMSHLHAPGLRVAGVTIPGLPGITLGHNDRIAWGITNFLGDVEDLYSERFAGDDKRMYMTPAGLREAEVRREEIRVRQNNVGTSVRVVPFDVTVTRHGPVIFEKADRRYALRWTALEQQPPDYETFFLLNSARNWDEFRAALGVYAGPPLNFIYADVEGHIGYYGVGKIPIRNKGDGTVPYDGTTVDEAWAGFIPFDELPNSFDPPAGMIVTANQRVVGKDYPYHITSTWPAPYRARRISDLLTAKEKLSLGDFRVIQADTYSFTDATFTGEVVKLARANFDKSPEWQKMLEDFDGWDGKASADSRAMLLSGKMHEAFEYHVLSIVFGDKREQHFPWPSRNTFIDKVITTRPVAWLPPGFDSYDALILACYKEAVADIKRTFGPDTSIWTWGNKPHRNFNHPLARLPLLGGQFALPRFPLTTGGSGDTVNAGPEVSMRLLVDLSNWDQTRQGISVGQSGDPASPHWKDQLTDWFNVAPRNFPFTDAAVNAAAKNSITLAPAER
jgi:penicillin amidase